MESSSARLLQCSQYVASLMTKFFVSALFLFLALMTASNASAQILLVSVDAASKNIGSYNPTTGAVINSSFITGASGTGVSNVYQMAADSNQIYVAELTGQVSVFNYSGSSVYTISKAKSIGVAVSGANLYAASITPNTVSSFNSQTGALTNSNFVPGATGSTAQRNLLTDGSGNLYVANNGTNGQVRKFDSTGTAVGGFTTINLTGAAGLALSGNILYVTNFSSGTTVLTYNATTGALINNSFATGLSGALGIEVYDNVLYVAEYTGKKVKTFNATTGALINGSLITSSFAISDVLILVPEPSTLTLAFLGAVGLLFLGKRRAVRARVSCETI